MKHVSVTGDGAKTTTISGIAQYHLTSHCVVRDGKFSFNGAVEYLTSLICHRNIFSK